MIAANTFLQLKVVTSSRWYGGYGASLLRNYIKFFQWIASTVSVINTVWLRVNSERFDNIPGNAYMVILIWLTADRMHFMHSKNGCVAHNNPSLKKPRSVWKYHQLNKFKVNSAEINYWTPSRNSYLKGFILNMIRIVSNKFKIEMYFGSSLNNKQKPSYTSTSSCILI